jgi:hypothetical protein
VPALPFIQLIATLVITVFFSSALMGADKDMDHIALARQNLRVYTNNVLIVSGRQPVSPLDRVIIYGVPASKEIGVCSVNNAVFQSTNRTEIRGLLSLLGGQESESPRLPEPTRHQRKLVVAFFEGRTAIAWLVISRGFDSLGVGFERIFADGTWHITGLKRMNNLTVWLAERSITLDAPETK